MRECAIKDACLRAKLLSGPAGSVPDSVGLFKDLGNTIEGRVTRLRRHPVGLAGQWAGRAQRAKKVNISLR